MAELRFKTRYPWRTWVAKCDDNPNYWLTLQAGKHFKCTRRSFLSRVVHYCKANGCDYIYDFPNDETIKLRIFSD